MPNPPKDENSPATPAVEPQKVSISPGELLKKISRPIVREDLGPDVDYSDGEAGSTRPEMPEDDGWKHEAMRYRENRKNDSAAFVAFVELFESEIERVNSPVLCLALHHVALRFHKCAGKKTIRKMHKAGLINLPEEIYPKDRISAGRGPQGGRVNG